eukprot:ANDGO_05528.mRNA.1 Protein STRICTOSIDINE SYNTHASE-LIKE 5
MNSSLNAFILLIGLLAAAYIRSPIEPTAGVFAPLPSLPADHTISMQFPERIWENELIGPESFAKESESTFFTGLLNGSIVRVLHDRDAEKVRFEEIARTKRPLGMRLNANRDIMYICDAYEGLFALNLATRSLELLAFENFTFTNSVAVGGKAQSGKLYFTDSSTRFGLHEFMYDILELGNTGRLFEFNLETRKLRLIADGLRFANGIVLDAREEHAFVALTSEAAIAKVNLASGQVTHLMDNLPGYPDNLSVEPTRGTFLAGLASPRFAPFELGTHLRAFPLVRKLVAGLVPLSVLQSLARPRGLLMEFDEDGIIVRIHDDESATVPFIVEGLEMDGFMYCSSFRNKFLGRFKLQ